MEISSAVWILDSTDWWHQHQETHSTYTDVSNVVCNIFSMIPHWVGVEASFSFGCDMIGCRQSITTGETLHGYVFIRQFPPANHVILSGDDRPLYMTKTDNDFEWMRDVEERHLHRMAKVHDFREMWQGSQNLHSTQKKSRAHNEQMTAIGYISDTEEIVKASCSTFQRDGVAGLTLSKTSPWPPAFSANDLRGG